MDEGFDKVAGHFEVKRGFPLGTSPGWPLPHADRHFWLAEQVTGVDAETLTREARSDLADSALHAP